MTTRRAAIFAHYDKDNVIDDYVIFYLQELKKVCEKLVFVSSCELDSEELKKLNDICDKTISENHKEYDFGSYKRGFFSLNKPEIYDEIIFANDSCFGPFYPLEQIFDKMNFKQCDFWGISENLVNLKGRYCPHIQTYFFVIRKNIVCDKNFKEFLCNVKCAENKNAIIKQYEIGFSELLHKLGYKSAAFVEDYKDYRNPTISKWREMFEKKLSPFVKCSLLRAQNTTMTIVTDWEKLFNQPELTMIKKNLTRTKTSHTYSNSKLKQILLNLTNSIHCPQPLYNLSKLVLKLID